MVDMPRSTLRLRIAAVLTVAVFVGGSLLFAATPMDDPFIYARYARNLLLDHDLVFNHGGPRIEGVSSLLWTLVYAAGEALGLPPLSLPRGLGIVLGGILVASVARQVLRRAPGVPAWVALVFLGASVDLAYYASCGMDHIFWALTAWLFLTWVGEAKAITRKHYLIAALGFFVRPEGFLLFVPALVRQLVDERRGASAPDAARSAAVTAAPGVALHAAFVAARWALFGRLLPNAAAAKHLGGSLFARLFDGLLYLGTGIELYLLPVAVAVAVGAFVAPSRDEEELGIPAVALVLAALGFAVLGGGDDTSAFGETRLFVPIIAPLTLLFAFGLRRVAGQPAAALRAGVLAIALLSVRLPRALLLLKRSAGANSLSTPRQILGRWVDGFRAEAPLQLSTYLRRATPPGALIAVPWAGRVPYETDLPTLDLLGLNDPHIALVPPPERGIDVRYDAAYVLAARPFYICENFRVHAPLDEVARAPDSALRELGAIKVGQISLLRQPDLARLYEVDTEAPTPGTCLRLKAPEKTR